ncbi:unnamed protein product [Psylliodes chrysocephalus]|uniref:Uncharacterized protein n=1 Tax=Psylliodes chrysocephalus TaxID=3402493 RepID=A0A9P0G7Q6_9CUCU|nr:unnamed protein product [Psylliodes chrysocephala]
MKAVNIFVCCVVAAMADLPASERTFLKQVHDACQSNPKTFCDENKLRNLSNNINDPQVGIHMSCMAIKAGLQHPNGQLNIPTMRIKVGLVVDQSKVEGVIQKCAKTAENPGKTANLMWVCFVKNNVEYYHKL